MAHTTHVYCYTFYISFSSSHHFQFVVIQRQQHNPFITMIIPLIVGAALFFLLALRVVIVLHGRKKISPAPRNSPISTVVVLGSGGHTTEMLQLLHSLSPDLYQPLTFIVAKTDTDEDNVRVPNRWRALAVGTLPSRC